MIYYKLIDELNFGEIIRDEGKCRYSYCFGSEKWVETGIMIRYQWPDDEYFDKYEEVSEAEAFKNINAQRLKMEQLFGLAKKIATEAHQGQRDKGGNPYINHPIAVAESLGCTEHKIVALLHDILEDSKITSDDLSKYGFTKRIIKSVNVLTKRDPMSYEEYLSRIRTDSNAWHVKIADIKHNMDISRIPNPTEDDYARIEKYKKALAYLDAPS
ncbi:MAG: hypothetical protein FWF88_13180 [Peptococcaceae bacterium]|nr:hypothetical protein [Peptococcaceae bacterium]